MCVHVYDTACKHACVRVCVCVVGAIGKAGSRSCRAHSMTFDSGLANRGAVRCVAVQCARCGHVVDVASKIN